MKILTSKQETRLEKKKKKIAALAELIKLNDKDRETISSDTMGVVEEPETKRRKLSETSVSESVDLELTEAKLNLSEEQYQQLKRELNERKRLIKNVPKFRLREFGERASLAVDHENRTPIFLTDIQHLLMNALIGSSSPCLPERWCTLEKPLKLAHTVVLVVEGLSLYHYLSNESQFTQTNQIFESKLEVVLPPCAEGDIIEDLARVPLTRSQKAELIRQYGSLEVAIEMNKDPTLIVNAIFKIEEEAKEAKQEDEGKPPAHNGEKVPRTKLLLSALQMVDEGYPLPLRGELARRYKDYVFTKDVYKPVTDSSPMYGVDCEMCRTAAGYNELTRISIVDEKLATVYESLVRPTNRITDYLTRYSGITEEMMLTVTKTLKEVQMEVRDLLPPDAILIGQSLNSDLHAMKMMHPYCIDTSVIFNITGVRKRKSKLQTLARIYLEESIQENKDGHDSIEDSRASMKLVQLKLDKGMDFGDVIMCGKRRANEIAGMKESEKIANNLFAHVSKVDRNTAIVTTKEINDKVRKLMEATDLTSIKCVEVDGNKEAIQKAQEIALENALTFVNLQVDSEKLELTKIEKTIGKVDKYIGKMWNSLAPNALFMVLFGGAAEAPSGLVNIKIKKRSTSAVREESPSPSSNGL